MGTSRETVAYVRGQPEPLDVRARAMFGEYGLYCDEKIVTLICDDTVHLTPTDVAADRLGPEFLAPPYPGAKEYYPIPTERLDDVAWLHALVQTSADMLPAPKPRTPAARKRSAPR